MKESTGRSFDVRFGPFRLIQFAEVWDSGRFEIGRVVDMWGFYVAWSRWTFQVTHR